MRADPLPLFACFERISSCIRESTEEHPGWVNRNRMSLRSRHIEASLQVPPRLKPK
jgi:hypothetical protein